MKDEGTKKIEEKVTSIVEKLIKNTDFILVDVSLKGIGGRKKLEIALDKPGGITLDDCEKISNEISLILDAEDLIQGPYILEVTSPGLDRILKTDRELNWGIGKKVIVYTENREYKGILKDFDSEAIFIEPELKISRKEVKKIKLDEV
uniref:Ribosome maturation factor RimP n=1 Tax=candidate division WOR-3 bacterium TaxID=2052148 RepID=A0A7C2K3G4_UNCW3